MSTDCTDCDPFLLMTKASESYSKICAFDYFFQAIVCVVGTIGNGLVLFITLSSKSKQPRNPGVVALMLLACVDLFVCMFLIPYEFYKLRHEYSQMSSVVCKSFEFVRTLSLTISSFILSVVAVERCKVMCSMNLQNRLFGYDKRARYALIAIFLLCIVLSTPVALLKGIQTRPVDLALLSRLSIFGYNESSRLLNISYTSSCEYLDKYNKSWYLHLHGVSFMALFVLLIIITTVCYGKIYYVINGSFTIKDKQNRVWPRTTERIIPKSENLISNLKDEPRRLTSPYFGTPAHKSKNCNVNPKLSATNIAVIFQNNKEGEKVENDNRKGKSLTFSGTKIVSANRRKHIFVSKLLFLITGIFIVVWTPFWILTVWYMYIPDLDNHLNAIQMAIAHNFYHFYFLNNAANPVLYAIYSSQFRMQCKRVFQTCGHRGKAIFCRKS